jgi:hypothetical protein
MELKPEAQAKETLYACKDDLRTRQPPHEPIMAKVTISFARASGFSGKKQSVSADHSFRLL